ncbi:MAG: DNA-directed RNA polymerase subunit omega [Panacagrimonas sp.]
MARAPVEDCLSVVPNHFELCAIATKRARQLVRGAPSELAAGTHKATVQSLLEIANGHVGRSVLDDADLPVIEIPKLRFDERELFGEG